MSCTLFAHSASTLSFLDLSNNFPGSTYLSLSCIVLSMAVEAQFCSGYSLVTPELKTNDGSSLPYAGISYTVHSLTQTQQRDTNNYIVKKYKELGQNIQEKRTRDLSQILHIMESKLGYLLIQKEHEIARARNRTAQLELILHKAQTEHQQWQNLALLKEAQAIALQQMLQQQSSFLHRFSIENDDAESCCDMDSSEKKRVGMVCRMCGERKACVVLLPCRHLCACAVCELVMDCCPVCTCLKQGAIHAMMF